MSSGHNPHGRLGQPNSSWNHLQVPSYIPRQPQLAHMSSERQGSMRSPPTWHTPTPPNETLLNFLAASNHTKSLDMLPFVTPNVPSQPPSFGGSVDLSLPTARNSLTPSPRNLHSPGVGNHSSTPPPELPNMKGNNLGGLGTAQTIPNCNRNLSPTPGVIQTVGHASKDRIQSGSPSIMNGGEIGNVHNSGGPGGLFIRDAIQINNDIANKLQHREPIGLPLMSEPVELVKEAIFHSMKNHSLSPSSFTHKSVKRTDLENELDRHRMAEEFMQTAFSQHELQTNNSTQIHSSTQPLVTPSLSSENQSRSSPIIHKMTSVISAANVVSPFNAPASNTVLQPNAPAVSPTNSDDSFDTSGVGSGNKRRKRKPNKTQRMQSTEDLCNIVRENFNDGINQNDQNPIDCSHLESSLIRNLDNLSGSLSDSTTQHNENRNSIQNTDTNSNNKNLSSNLEVNSNENHLTDSDKNKTIESGNGVANTMQGVSGSGESKAQQNNNNQASDKSSSSNSNCSKNDLDDCETIDKIAEMIAKTTNRSIDLDDSQIISTSHTKQRTPQCDDIDLEITLNGSMFHNNCPEQRVCNDNIVDSQRGKTDLPINVVKLSTELDNTITDKNSSYEDVENKLEELFAGIEDDRPVQPDSDKIAGDKSSDSTANVNGGDLEQIKNNEAYDGDDIESQTNQNKGLKRGKSEIDIDEIPLSNKRKRVVKRRRRGGAGASKLKKSKMAATSTPKGNSKDMSSSSIVSIGVKSKGPIVVREENHRGPYVYVRPDGDISVINCPNGDDDAEKAQGKQKKQIPGQSSERNHIRGLHVSTLSMKYDADTRDVSWICVFCKMGPHKNGLGDLFGPYIMATDCDEFQLSQNDPALDAFKSKRTKQDMIQKYIAGKRLADTTNATSLPTASVGKKKKSFGQPKTPTPDQQQSLIGGTDMKSMVAVEDVNIFAGMTIASDTSYEVWVHEDCAVWASGVHIVGVRILGLESAVWSSTRHFCTICSQNGAMLCCLQRGCSNQVHVPCAKLNNWSLNDLDFKSYCGAHKPSNLLMS